MPEKITFTVNGTSRIVEREESEKLIHILREKLNLTGTKRGCDDASCGACVVMVDDEAIKSCTFPGKKLDGKEVLTIEGMADGTNLHPIQRALIDTGAVQCGYCTPGIVMELFALFNRQPAAPDDEIKEVLSRHLCRCTGYEAMYDGALLARKYLSEAADR